MRIDVEGFPNKGGLRRRDAIAHAPLVYSGAAHTEESGYSLLSPVFLHHVSECFHAPSVTYGDMGCQAQKTPLVSDMKIQTCENACMNTSRQIRTLREQRNLSQEGFAEAIGKSRSLVAAWEAGRKEPGRDSLQAISRVFGVPMSYILGDDASVKAVAEGPSEVTLLEMFRSADAVTQNSVLHILSLSKAKE